MAVLNIKNLPDGLYRKLQARGKARASIHRAGGYPSPHRCTLEVPQPLSILDWARSTGGELTLRNILRENEPHGING